MTSTWSVLAGLLDTDEDRLIDLLEGAIGAGLISESEDEIGRYRFVHALIQHTLYQDLGATRRQRAHQRVAEALEARSTDDDEHVAELARHWMAATRPSDATKALYYARRAGEAALAAYAPIDAVSWYSQALELHSRQALGDERERCVLLVGLGTAQRQAGQSEYRQTLLMRRPSPRASVTPSCWWQRRWEEPVGFRLLRRGTPS